MEFNEATFILLSSLSLVAGILSAIAGSSGLLMLPALLLTGMPPHIALGTNKLYTTASLLTSAWVFIKQHLFDYRLWMAAIIATMVGSIVGALIALVLPTDVISFVLPICMLAITVYFLLPQKIRPGSVTDALPAKPCSIRSGIMGGIIGLYSGFIGAGTGSLWTSAAMTIFKIDLLEASAISRVMCFLSNAIGLLVFVLLRDVNYLLGSGLVLFGSIGAYIGSKLSIQYGKHIIRPTIILLSGGMAIKLMFDYWF